MWKIITTIATPTMAIKRQFGSKFLYKTSYRDGYVKGYDAGYRSVTGESYGTRY